MNIIDIIIKKKNKEELTKEEIDYVVTGYLNDTIKDYQMSSLLMAIVINGMTFDETYNLTISMLNSGEILDLSEIQGTIVDKHSTGGVGDKTSLVVLPLVASCNVKIAKMSGKGLGFTGGTIDKLESINFDTKISKEEFIKEVNDINISLVSQSGNLVPADKKIYSLRDVTGTFESIPLIASSIMSKKLASGSDKILLDVKVGKGAFMKNIDDAKKLAKMMVEIGKKFGKETVALITNMNYPLGNTIGNKLEVLEAYNTLDNNGNDYFIKLCLIISSYMVSLGKNISIDDAIEEVKTNFYNKKGLDKFKEFIKYQKGDLSLINLDNNYISINSDKAGFVSDIDTLELAKLGNDLGIGRKTIDDVIDYDAGIILVKNLNDKVEVGDTLMKVYSKKEVNIEKFRKTFNITLDKNNDLDIVYEIIK